MSPLMRRRKRDALRLAEMAEALRLLETTSEKQAAAAAHEDAVKRAKWKRRIKAKRRAGKEEAQQ